LLPHSAEFISTRQDVAVERIRLPLRKRSTNIVLEYRVSEDGWLKEMQRSSPDSQDTPSGQAPHDSRQPGASPFDQAGGEWKERLKDIVRRNHRRPIFAMLARASKTYLRAYYNENHYRFPHNGERFVIDTFRRIKGDSGIVAFDVGAHTGSWTREFLQRLPSAQIHCFELAPETFNVLQAAVGGRANVHVNRMGLSDGEGELELSYVPGATTISTLHRATLATTWGLVHESVKVPVTAGARYMTERGIDRVDFLKVDTEGHDLSVLRGFRESLASRPIPLIQFEHGFVHIPAKSLLCGFYEYLTPLGYAIGRLHPRCVQFKDYDLFEDEQFRMGNYIAVHSSERELARALRSDG
jgi:FkbM family methyltransferase